MLYQKVSTNVEYGLISSKYSANIEYGLEPSRVSIFLIVQYKFSNWLSPTGFLKLFPSYCTWNYSLRDSDFDFCCSLHILTPNPLIMRFEHKDKETTKKALRIL